MGGSKKMQQVRSIANRPSGGGNKKQGLVPTGGRPGWLSNFIRTNAGGYFRGIPGPAQEVISKTVGEFNNIVITLQHDATGNNLYVGGYFTSYTSPTGVITTVNRIAKIRLSDGALITGFVDSGEGFINNVLILQLDATGNNLYVGGNFTGAGSYDNSAGGGTPKYIAKLNTTNGALDAGFVGDEEGFINTVNTLQFDATGNNLYVGGNFTSYTNSAGGGGVQRIAKLNATTGALDTGFVGGGEGFINNVLILQLDATGNNLYVGGNFTGAGSYDNSAGGGTPKYIAKLNTTNGALDAGFVGDEEGFINTVNTLQFDATGNNLYVGGNFTSYTNSAGGGGVQRIAKLNATTGALDTGFVGGGQGFNSHVWALQLDATGNLYAGGIFTTYTNSAGGTPQHIAKLDTTNGDLITGFVGDGEGFNGNVNTLQLDATRNNLHVGGDFTSYTNSAGGGTPKYIAKLNATNGGLNK